MDENIRKALARQFEKHRIVIWQDTDAEFADSFASFDLPDVVPLEVENNEFGLKYRVLRQEPDKKFLLYRRGKVPEDRDNWLLDLELASSVFVADQASIWVQEIGLPYEFVSIVKEHEAFFAAAKRREGLKELLVPADNRQKILLKMVAVCCNADPQLDAIMGTLLAETAIEKDDRQGLLSRCNLNSFFWQQVQRAYGFVSERPSIREFSISLFESAYSMSLGETAVLNQGAVLLLKGWKDNRKYQDEFVSLSRKVGEWLQIEGSIDNRDYREFGHVDYFEQIEKAVLEGLISDVERGTISAEECEAIVQSRRSSIWFDRYATAYACIVHARQVQQLFSNMAMDATDVSQAFDQYANGGYEIDLHYRSFLAALRKTEFVSVFKDLREKIENLYVNRFLLHLNNHWQQLIDDLSEWKIPSVQSQRLFFKNYVEPILKSDQKVYIVVSDALRFEAASQLVDMILEEDRFEAKLDATLGVLPSYTALGMAALLPHKELAITAEKTPTVMVDGKPSQGMENRKKILSEWKGKRGTALGWEEFRKMDRDESRELVRESDFIYVFHNQIDAVGDKRYSEERLPEAVEQAQEELIQILKKLASANATNMIVTADHGFLYQARELDEGDFAVGEMRGDQVLVQTRRYVIGQDLQPDRSFMIFDSKGLGLTGNVEVAIPKSVNRMRKSGSGSRYVHGGATLQEITVPVIKVRKKRQSDLECVDVEILRGDETRITTNQFTIRLYQTQPVRDKLLGRTLKVGLFAQDGERLSDQVELFFDSESDSARAREKKVKLLLDQRAGKYKRQMVNLKLLEKIPGTERYREYKSQQYELRQSIASDFD